MEDDDSGDQGEWAQVTARKNRKSRKHADAKGDGDHNDTDQLLTDAVEVDSKALAKADNADAGSDVSPTATRAQQGTSWVPYEDEVEYTNVPPECPLKDPLDADPQLQVTMPDGGCPWATLLRDEGGFPPPAARQFDDEVEYPDTDEEVLYPMMRPPLYGWYR
jgi:hypothetical protein